MTGPPSRDDAGTITWPRRELTIHECPAREQRLPGDQRCGDCGISACRTGPGGPCPHCSEPAAIADLTKEVTIMPGSS